MQIFYWIIFLVAIGIAIFTVQNSSGPLITIKFLIWRFETSLIYTVLGSFGLGILIPLFFWIPRAIRSTLRTRRLKREIEEIKTKQYGPSPIGQEENRLKDT